MSHRHHGHPQHQTHPLADSIAGLLPGLLLAVVVSFFASLCQLIPPLYMLQVFNRVLTSGSTATLAWLTIITLFGLAVYGLLDIGRARIYLALANWLNGRLGLEVLGLAVSTAVRGSSLAGEALRDVDQLRQFFSAGSLTSCLDLLWTPVFIIALFLLHPAYGVTAMVAAAIMLALGIATEAMTHGPTQRANDLQRQSLNGIANAVRHAEAIEAMGLLKPLARRWHRANDSMRAAADTASRRALTMASLSKTFQGMVQVMMMTLGVVLVVRNEASFATYMAASIIAGRCLSPFSGIIANWRQWLAIYAAYRRLRTLFDEQGAARSTMPLPRPQGPVEIDRVVFVPPGCNRAVLKGVSLVLQPGEAIGIVGPSTAGKSTLARLLVGVFRPTGGAIRLDGYDTFLWERENFGSYVGYLPQSVSLLDGTIRDNIARFDDGAADAVVAAAKKADVHGMIGRLPKGYDTPVEEAAYLLSGGQKQRIALARALYGDPALLVLDEPDASLDAAGEAALLKAVEAAKAKGAIVVVITHRQSILRGLDKFLLLKDGAVQGFGPAAEVMPDLLAAAPRTLAAVAAPRQLEGR
jgi:ATP-binding cassette subfamily C protein